MTPERPPLSRSHFVFLHERPPLIRFPLRLCIKGSRYHVSHVNDGPAAAKCGFPNDDKSPTTALTPIRATHK